MPKRKTQSAVKDLVPAKKAKVGKQQITNKGKGKKSKGQTKTEKKLSTKKGPKTQKPVTKGKTKQVVKKKLHVQPTPVKSASKSKSKLNIKDLLKDEKWKAALADEFEHPYFKQLEGRLGQEYAKGIEIFPPEDLIFNALDLTPLDKVKVVILGQDPYHDNGQAMGLSFSVPKGIAVPPSLKNIYNELDRDRKITGFKIPDHGCLEDWARQGILMINATLTVEAHKANSHASFGWQTFTDSVIKAVSTRCDHVVFILWGGFAQKKEKLIDLNKHIAIKTAHPSPLSLNKFKNCNCFSDCNDALVKLGLKPINWALT